MKDFKVRCLETADRDFAVGNIYSVKGGQIIDDDGDARPMGTKRYFDSLEEINKFEDFGKFELVEEEKMFTKDDLKVGYVLEMRSGKIKMIVNTQTGLVAAGENTPYDPIDSFRNDLKPNWCIENTYDVMKVYGFAETPSDALKASTSGRPLIWERKEGPIEITIEEIAKLKGVSADRIRIKE